MFDGLRGRFEKAKELYETTPKNSRLRLCALNSAAFATVFVGDYELFDKIYGEIGEMRRCSEDALRHFLLDLSTRMILVTMRVPVQTFSIEKLPKLPSVTLKNVFLVNSYVDVFLSRNYANYEKILTLAEVIYKHYIVVRNRFTSNRASTILSISEQNLAQNVTHG